MPTSAAAHSVQVASRRQPTLLQRTVIASVACGTAWMLGALVVPSARAEDEAEFFERRVRPLLVERCTECHGPDVQEGHLRLDSRDGWSHGGDNGPALLPGDPEGSLLVAAVRYADPRRRMPPDGRLPDGEIAALEEWIREGAYDPRTELASSERTTGLDVASAQEHWAYRPPVGTDPPAVRASEWPLDAIDRFVLAGIEAAGFAPAAEAPRASLIRRLYFDLRGLPPTPEEIEAFAADRAPDAYERLVDRLLTSPHFGERWGRHWLDVARFGESVTLRGFVFGEAWRYRDWVIEAFDRDLPYDRFVAQQIAGDLLPADSWEERQRQRVATAFLVLGNTNFEEQDKRQLELDVVDEQLDALGKAFLAQTIGCARCHDHKFDPIPTRDYYALAGILRGATSLEHANVSKWIELPLPVAPDEETRLAAHEADVTELRGQVEAARARLTALTATAAGTPDVVAAEDLPGFVVDSAQAQLVGEWKHSQSVRPYIGDGYLHDLDERKGAKTITFQPAELTAGRYEVRLAYTPGDNRAARVPVAILHADGETEIEIDERIDPPADRHFVSLGTYRFEQGNQGVVRIATAGTAGHVVADAVQFLPADGIDPGSNAAANAAASSAPVDATSADAVGDDPDLLRAEVATLESRLKELVDSGPKRPRTMTVREDGPFQDLPVYRRGSVHAPAELAPRGFLQAATLGPTLAIPAGESGRRQLAEWLASADNPLAARVAVNRVWHWLFGAGLVRTTDNFGTTGEAPSHPELLDRLALDFVADGWSTKRLVRRIVLSRTYRQASDNDPQTLAADPENRLFARAHRRRLDAECLRDAMLSAAGRLDLRRGGPRFPPRLEADYGYRHDEPCRSVYVPVFRNALPELFELFDFPDPSTVAGRRNNSTVAPQALFLLNHPFVREQAQATAERLLRDERLADDAARIDWLYRALVGRAPSPPEAAAALEYVMAEGTADTQRWADVAQALFASPEFRTLE